MQEIIPDILAQRYASEEMGRIWSPKGKILLERELWIAVMKAQKKLGLDIPDDAIEAYERVKNRVDLDSMERRERVTRHDVKARIDEFCALAGFEYVHMGMTSRDLTECAEQIQIFSSLKKVRFKAAAALFKLADAAREHAETPLVARTHNVPAQLTTFGKRLAEYGEDLLHALDRLDFLIKNYPARGIKGAVGTQADQLALFAQNADAARALDAEIAGILGIPKSLGAVGQVYPRTLDFECVSALFQTACGPSSFAKTLRIMAGAGLADEGFAKGQTGSSAMPHKVNSRTCERINGLHAVLGGFCNMLSSLAGDQWNEGDVSCSCVRRVALPGAFFAVDGLLDAFITVLARMRPKLPAMKAERLRQTPFLLTTAVLMEAVKKGAGRESAHEVIKENAMAAAAALESGEISENDLFERLAADPRLPLDKRELEAVRARYSDKTGLAKEQTLDFCARARAKAAESEGAEDYAPPELL